MRMSKTEHQDESSSASSAHAESAVALPNVLRRIPRVVWLVLSAITLIAGSLAWHYQNPKWNAEGNESAGFWDWWARPKVQNAHASLPEISGRIYGISIEHRATGSDRIWITGAGGLLAYSDDEGKCWTRFVYDATRGEFHEPSNNPCGVDEKRAAVSWPQFVPTVFAAEQEQSSAPTKKPIPPALGTVEQRPSSTRQQPPVEQKPTPAQQQQPQQKQPDVRRNQMQHRCSRRVNRRPPRIQPARLRHCGSFHGNQLRGSDGIQLSASSQVKRFTIQNAGTTARRVFVSGVNDDKSGEFDIQFPSCSPPSRRTDVITVEKECEGLISFVPKEAGKRSSRSACKVMVGQSR